MAAPTEQIFIEGEVYSGTLSVIEGDQSLDGEEPVGVTYGMLLVKPPFVPTELLLDQVASNELCEPQPEIAHYATTASATAISLTVGHAALEHHDSRLGTHQQRAAVAHSASAYLIEKLNQIESGNVTL